MGEERNPEVIAKAVEIARRLECGAQVSEQGGPFETILCCDPRLTIDAFPEAISRWAYRSTGGGRVDPRETTQQVAQKAARAALLAALDMDPIGDDMEAVADAIVAAFDREKAETGGWTPIMIAQAAVAAIKERVQGEKVSQND